MLLAGSVSLSSSSRGGCGNDVLRHEFERPSVPFGEFSVTSTIESDHHIQLWNDEHDLAAIAASGEGTVNVIGSSQRIDVPAVPILVIGSAALPKLLTAC